MILEYDEKYKEAWDEFVLNNSINGNFLQTRNFLNYHPQKTFVDASIIFMKGDRVAAVLPANTIDGGATLIAHQGSTYGGIVIGKEFSNTINYDWIFDEMSSYFKEKGYARVMLKMHSWLYSPVDELNELCEYYLQLYGFTVVSEIGFFIDLGRVDEDYTIHFEKLKRRKLNKAIKNNLVFRKISTDDDISIFYEVLSDNMKKFNTVPTHTCEQLVEFKNSRLPDITSFYGVYYEDIMIAGSMVWNFCNKKVFHTQYLASRHDYLEYCPNEFLYANLIKAAKDEGYRFLSYGTASLERGWAYNKTLGMYKEGFNTDTYMNRRYIWENNK